jgi:hypothetical protein
MQMPYDPYPYSIIGDACAERERQESERASERETHPRERASERASEREKEIETAGTLSGAIRYKSWE